MTIKDLSNYILIKEEIKRLKDRLYEIESTMIGSSKFSDMKVSSTRCTDSKVENIAIKISDIKSKIEYQIEKSLEEELKLENFILNIKDKRIKLIIRLRFVEGKTWQQVADLLSYDRSTPRKKVLAYLEGNNEII